MRTRFLVVLGFAAWGVVSVATLRASPPAAKQTSYDVQGKYYDTCACPVSCSCGANVTLPVEGHCAGVILLHIEKGRVGEVNFDGLNIAIVERTPNGMKTGDAFLIKRDMDLLTVYLDDQASPRQKEAMPILLAGLLGTKQIKGFRPPQWVPMNLRVEGDIARFRIAGGTKLSFEIENVDLDKVEPGVPRSEPSKRITLTNVAPFAFIHNVTQGYSKSFHYADLGAAWDFKERNAFFGTFAARGVAPAPRAPK